MDEIINATAPVIVPFLGTLVTTLFSWVMVQLGAFVRTKTKNTAAIGAIDTIGSITTTVVKDLAQTTVKEMKNGGRCLDTSQKANIKRTAIDSIKKQIPTAVAKAAQMGVNSLDDYISSKVEETCLDLKKGS